MSRMVLDTPRAHTRARRVTSLWHGGGGSALYVLCSTGAIVLNDQGMEWLNAKDEAARCWQDGLSPKDVRDIAFLEAYIEHHGSRGPVEDWYAISFA